MMMHADRADGELRRDAMHVRRGGEGGDGTTGGGDDEGRAARRRDDDRAVRAGVCRRSSRATQEDGRRGGRWRTISIATRGDGGVMLIRMSTGRYPPLKVDKLSPESAPLPLNIVGRDNLPKGFGRGVKAHILLAEAE